MQNILVIGGGFAGVWSAAGAVRTAREHGVPDSELRVTLISNSDDLVIRPRLYEDAPETLRVSLDRVLGPIGVQRIAATVTDIDTTTRTVTALERDTRTVTLDYDRLVLAAGSQLTRPHLPGAHCFFDIDTMSTAAALDHHLRRLPERSAHAGQYSAVVVGAGFTGLEIATELTRRLADAAALADDGSADRVRVVLVEQADEIGPELGEGPRPHITSVLAELGIEQRLATTVEQITEDAVTLSTGEVIPAATAIWTAGMTASPLTASVPGERDWQGRLVVDEHLRVVGAPEVYAAGDTAAAQVDPGHQVMQSCQHAVPLGKFAGHNVAADLLDLSQAPFAPDPYVTCLDLGPAGAVLTAGWDRTVQTTGHHAKKMKQQINTEWIYPPVDDAAAILKLADYHTTWPTGDSGV